MVEARIKNPTLVGIHGASFGYTYIHTSAYISNIIKKRVLFTCTRRTASITGEANNQKTGRNVALEYDFYVPVLLIASTRHHPKLNGRVPAISWRTPKSLALKYRSFSEYRRKPRSHHALERCATFQSRFLDNRVVSMDALNTHINVEPSFVVADVRGKSKYYVIYTYAYTILYGNAKCIIVYKNSQDDSRLIDASSTHQ